MPGGVLILGGQRSGKSRYGEALVAASGRAMVYLATAAAGDDEMAARIAEHRARRGANWWTIEEPLELVAMLAAVAAAESAVLVDCLTLWLANLMAADRNVDEETDRLVGVLAGAAGPVVLISNEVGSGIVPANPLARRFADAHGILNQRVAAAVDRVVLMAAGLPVLVKPQKTPEIAL